MEKEIQKSSDVWFVTFLKYNGYTIIDYEVTRKGRGKFIFELENEDWKNLKLEFEHSEFSRFKQVMMSVKDLVYL